MKKGQLKLSFGMIFSIILIIAFLAFGFYAIKFILNLNDITKVAQFIDDLQTSVDKMWKGSEGSQVKTFSLPKKIQYVCFVDYYSGKRGAKFVFYDPLKQVFYEKENMFFYPVGSGEGNDAVYIKHVDIEAITSAENPFCIINKNGQVKLTIKKNYGDNLVKILR